MNWIFGTTPLDTFGSVVILEDFLDAPQKRGENIIIPYRHGRLHVDKYYEQRVLGFGIVMEAVSRSALESKMDTLKRLMASGRQTLRAQFNNGVERIAQAEMVNELGLNRLSPCVARITMEFLLAEPFLRSNTLTSVTTTIDASPKAVTVTNPGTVEERDAMIVLTGPLDDTEITNTTNGYILRYNAAIASPRVVTIQTVDGQYTATDDLDANKIGNITHEGGSALMALDAGDNAMSIKDDVATTGTVGFQFYAPYL